MIIESYLSNLRNILANKWNIGFLFIVLAGLVIRICSLNYGLPFVVGPDETRQILDTFGMASRLSLIPQDFAYASLHKYLLLFLFGAYFFIGHLIGLFKDKFNFAFQFFAHPYSFYLLARMLSAILGTALIIVGYKAAKVLFDKKTALLTAVFIALNFHLVQLSYWASSDIVLIFFSGMSFLFISKVIKFPCIRNVMWASLCVGLAISSKFQGVMLMIPLGVSLILNFYKDRHFLKIFTTSLTFVVLSALIGNIQYLIKPAEALEKFSEILNASQLGISSAPVFSHNIFDSTKWYFRELIRQDGLIGLLFCLGSIYAVIRIKRTENIVFLAFFGIFLLFFSRSSLRYIYYGALIFPTMAVFAAKFVLDITSKLKLHKVIISFLITGVIILSLVNVLLACIKRSNLDTRQLAKNWIESNIPKGENIAVDWYELSVPLETIVPFMVNTGSAGKYYEQVTPSIREGYFNFVSENRQYYHVIPVIYEKDSDFWPQEILLESLNKSANIKFAKHLYSRFNFYDLESLVRKGVRYLVISSYSYSHFLLDNDPAKTELLNPYLSEKTLINNRQADNYDSRIEENILFYLAQRARNFYLPLLKSEESRVTLLKEFSPGKFNLGPVITIYSIK